MQGAAQELEQKVLAGDVRALSRAATWIESESAAGRQLLSALLPHTGKAMIVGVTGPPGAGKSTLVDQIAKTLRARAKKVGIVAVDPSSPYTRGAILGDRIRMQDHHADAGVFIRSMASRGNPGGIARTTLDTALLLDAAGFDAVLIETVGVGQDEVAIAQLADVTVVVMAPGLGDDVQAIKAGIMEIADVFAINKSDLPGVDRLENEIRGMQSLGDERQRAEAALVRRVIAADGTGVEDLLGAVESVFERRGREARRRSRGSRAAQTRVEIDHLGIAVRTLDEGLHLYQDLLGMSDSHRETVESERVHVAMLPAGAGSEAPRIELLEATDADSPVAKFIANRGPGLHHIALRVDDLEGTAARLRASGARLLNEPRSGAGGHTYVFIHPSSAGGVLLELIQK